MQKQQRGKQESGSLRLNLHERRVELRQSLFCVVLVSKLPRSYATASASVPYDAVGSCSVMRFQGSIRKPVDCWPTGGLRFAMPRLADSRLADTASILSVLKSGQGVRYGLAPLQMRPVTWG